MDDSFFNGMQNVETTISILTIMGKSLTITVNFLKTQPVEVKTQIVQKVGGGIFAYVWLQKIHPIIYEKMPLAETADVHRLMESNEYIEKVLLTMN